MSYRAHLYHKGCSYKSFNVSKLENIDSLKECLWHLKKVVEKTNVDDYPEGYHARRIIAEIISECELGVKL